MEIKIHCTYDELVDPNLLIPNPRNPNTHPKNQIELLAKLIGHHGWRRNIVVSKRSGFIVSGHGRHLAALVLNAEKVPIDYQDYETEADEYADLIADNKIAELAESDTELLKNLINELDKMEYDLDLVGFENNSIVALLEEINDDKYSQKNKEIDIDNLMDNNKVLHCPKCGFEFEK